MSIRLDRPVNEASDHVLGSPGADINLVEYGSYACPYCRAANEHITETRDRLGDRLLYVFRHRPIPGNDLALRAAELAERAAGSGQFWKAHVALMSRSSELTETDLQAVAADLDLPGESPAGSMDSAHAAKERVEADVASARASGVVVTPTFFINGRKYQGVWNESELTDALLGSLGHRVRSAALDFARWAPSAGVLLLLTTIIAVVLTNSPAASAFTSFWNTLLGFTWGGNTFQMSVLNWINNGLLTVFFLVVGLEIKREFTVGHLASRRSAALPVAAAIGGMIGPILLYRLIVATGPWAQGWGCVMSTDTAFAIALIVMLGRRVPIELRIFLTAAAIVDDIGAVTVVALFYSTDLQFGYLLTAAVLIVLLALLNRLRIYRVTPYLLLGLALWASVYAGGLHPTLAGVILALFIPTRPPPNLRALQAQADAILIAEARHSSDELRTGPSAPAMDALDAIHERLESPADRMLRTVSLRSNYVVLPLFALANAGVAASFSVLEGHSSIAIAIILGLVAGKPLGMIAASAVAVKLGIAVKPDAYSWRQLGGASALAGIGFTMSLFIAGEAFTNPSDFAAAKIAVFTASILSAILGLAVLRASPRNSSVESVEAAT